MKCKCAQPRGGAHVCVSVLQAAKLFIVSRQSGHGMCQ